MSNVPSGARQAIGSYLRQQRLGAAPDQFAQLKRRRRHVAHLTQGDVAELAGVSTAVVAQVENGRYANLNPSLVQKLGQALGLSENKKEYLINFLQRSNGHLHVQPDELPMSVRSVVDMAEPNPAVLINARFDILYWNRGATMMLTDFGKLPVSQRNVVVSMFCVPGMRVSWKDWESNARNIVAGLRMQASHQPAFRDAINELAGEMSRVDPLFKRWWSSEDPAIQPHREKDFDHPRLGPMRLYQTVSAILGSPHLSIIVYTPRDEETERLFREL